MGPLYRLWQFLVSLRALFRPPEDDTARALLSPAAYTLFAQMVPYDRAHALRVLHSLQHSGVSDPNLLQAALLHDLGKSAGKERIPFLCRGPIVLAHARPRLWAWLSRERPRGDPRRSFFLYATHAARGAALSRGAGVAESVASLIAAHHDQGAAGTLALLEEADRRS